jgi:hypothetical protein
MFDDLTRTEFKTTARYAHSEDAILAADQTPDQPLAPLPPDGAIDSVARGNYR